MALAELQVYVGGQNVALGARVTSSDSDETPPIWSQHNLVDGFVDGRPLLEWPVYLDSLLRREYLLAIHNARLNERQRELDRTSNAVLGFFTGTCLLGLVAGGWS